VADTTDLRFSSIPSPQKEHLTQEDTTDFKICSIQSPLKALSIGLNLSKLKIHPPTPKKAIRLILQKTIIHPLVHAKK